ncbi:MAG: hypothetical protein AOA65_0648 [Candidatus Bathyarchaeota archaeon BA1]|nr:MAG: hypothetical protein AOA65_0648 [Candidatus Bathyarchaeota archaeon BA1]
MRVRLLRGVVVDFEPWLYVIAVVGAALAVLLLIYVMGVGRRKGEGKAPMEEVPGVREPWPLLKAERSVMPDEARKARDELRTMDLEREILSYAIRRLYEAQAEGKISEEERDRLAHRYKSRMMKIKEGISKSESVVALHELEAMREDLAKLFSERFDEINRKIEEVRSRMEVKPAVEVPTAPTAPPEKERRRVRRRRPPPPSKTEAEKRIEEIKGEVEKVLERLGQIEIEA